jgi:hypothetical protein
MPPFSAAEAVAANAKHIKKSPTDNVILELMDLLLRNEKPEHDEQVVNQLVFLVSHNQLQAAAAENGYGSLQLENYENLLRSCYVSRGWSIESYRSFIGHLVYKFMAPIV